MGLSRRSQSRGRCAGAGGAGIEFLRCRDRNGGEFQRKRRGRSHTRGKFGKPASGSREALQTAEAVSRIARGGPPLSGYCEGAADTHVDGGGISAQGHSAVEEIQSMKEPYENAVHNHPSEVELVELIREGMKAEEAERILLHLDSCTACEQRREAIEPLLRRYREMRADSFPELPSWPDLADAMDRMDARKSPSRVRRPAWAGLIAAGVVFCGFLLWPTSRQAELRAGTLLREAQRAEPVDGLKRRVKVKTAAGSFVRPAVLRGNLATDAVGARFKSARYDWNDPLGPASY